MSKMTCEDWSKLKVGDWYTDDKGIKRQLVYFNEACAVCSRAADSHDFSPENGFQESDHEFVRCDPPRAAYGAAFWKMSEQEQKDYFRNQLLG